MKNNRFQMFFDFLILALGFWGGLQCRDMSCVRANPHPTEFWQYPEVMQSVHNHVTSGQTSGETK